MLVRAFYQSRIIGKFGPVSLLTLQRKCLERNREAGITSFLYHDEARIFQVLEGPGDAVDDCLARISADPVHDSLQIRAMMRSETAEFPHWHFGATTSEDPDFRRAANAAHVSDFFLLDVLQADRILSMIANRKRRATGSALYSVMFRDLARAGPPSLLGAAGRGGGRKRKVMSAS